MRHPRALVVAVLASVLASALAAGCGDNTQPDPFLGLVRVSGQTPFADDCDRGTAGTGSVFAGVEVEPSVAVDPTNPAHVVGAWQQDRWSNGGSRGIGAAASFDGGATWVTSVPHFGRCAPGPQTGTGDYPRATDPWLTFAADGTPYLAALVFDSATSRSAMAVSRSGDGGRTWDEPVVIQADSDPDVFNDKDSITADPTDPGRVYVVWDRLTGQLQPAQPGTGPTWFARLTNGVWEPARAIVDPGLDTQTIGNIIVVLPDGTLVVVLDLITHNSSQSPQSMLAVARSTDHGTTWSAPVSVTPMHGAGVRDPASNEFIRSGTDLPSVAVDRATGQLYVVWEDLQPGSLTDGVWLVSSTDGGLTWSPRQSINGAPEVAAFTPIVAVASDGTVGVLYYDLRTGDFDEAAFRSTAWLALSHDHGATWGDEPLGASFDLRPANLKNVYFLGDYEGLTTAGAMFLPFFVGTTRGGDADRTDVFVRALE